MTTAKKYYINPDGDKVPVKAVTPYERKRDRIANQIAKLWMAEEKRLAELKEKTVVMINDLRHTSRSNITVKNLGGAKGNIQFRNYEGTVTVTLDKSRQTEFDERLQVAQELIMQAVRELANGEHNADLIELATKAFQPRKSGNLDMQRIRDLRHYNIKHPLWKQAIEIISKCERTVGHRQYMRVAIRERNDNKPRNILLDIAKV